MRYFGGWKWTGLRRGDALPTTRARSPTGKRGFSNGRGTSPPVKKLKHSSSPRGGNPRYSRTSRLSSTSQHQAKRKRENEDGDTMELRCPHCRHVSDTFKNYEEHLEGGKHQIAMKRVFVELIKVLNGMLTKQKEEQTVKDAAEERRNLEVRFCFSCQLHYKDSTQEHVSSSSHKSVMGFLKPSCKVCETTSESFMNYEEHICELNHFKKKAKNSNKRLAVTDKYSDEDEEEKKVENDCEGEKKEEENTSDVQNKEEISTGEKEMENVPSAKREEESYQGEQKSQNEDRNGKEKNKVSRKKRKISRPELIRIGMEYCELIKVYYCDLCKKYVGQKLQSVGRHYLSKDHIRRKLRQNKLECRNAYILSRRQKALMRPGGVT